MESIKKNIYLSNLVFASLLMLALGLLTSISILALSHIFIIIPIIYFLTKTDFKELPPSAWALLALSIVIILSVLFNQDVAINGYKPIGKTKYFLFGFFSLVPIQWFCRNYLTEKKMSILLYVFCISATIATVSGMVGFFSGYNPLLFAKVLAWKRNGGVFGMLMNYAHNMSFFLIILLGLLFNRKKIERIINYRFLIVVFIINLVGFYFTYTRGAWLGFIAGVPMFFFKENKKLFFKSSISLLLVGGGVYLLAGNNVVRSYSDNQRISQWKASTYAAKERPLLGYGYMNIEPQSTAIKLRYGIHDPKFTGHAHNNFFEILGGTGLLGLFVFCIWLWRWLVESYESTSALSSTSLAFVVTFVFGGLTQSTISLGINLFFIIGAYSFFSAQSSRHSFLKNE